MLRSRAGRSASGGHALYRFLALVVLSLVAFVLPRAAAADTASAHSVPVAVLALDSDDAEEQADGLTAALRSRIRTSAGWSLVETSQSLGMLTAALRCPSKAVPPECEQKIADQLKADRYIFGYVTKGPQGGQVTAEVHLFQRGKPDVVIRESYAENLKDPSDDTLRRIAQRIVDRLGGTALGTIVVRAAGGPGEVVVDGDKRVPLVNGVARVELSPGSHSVEVAIPGQPSHKKTVLVSAGKETAVEVAVAPPPAPPPKRTKPFPTRKLIGGLLAAGGAAALTISIINLDAWLSDQDLGEQCQAGTAPGCAIGGQNPPLPPQQTPDDVCGQALYKNSRICTIEKDADRHSAIAWATGLGGLALLGTGVFLFVTDGGSDAPEKSGKSKRPRLVPTVGRGVGGLVLSGSF